MSNQALQFLKNDLLKHVNAEKLPQREKIVRDIATRLNEGAFVSYAQNFEDVILRRVFGDKNSGFYVDVGAFDPYLKSVTCLFYLQGWRGLNIDLCEKNIAEFKRCRHRDINVCAAVGSRSGQEEFYVQPGTPRSTKLKKLGMSYKDKGTEVITEVRGVYSLTDLLARHGVEEIDFLSMDVEGAEKDVFEGLDLNRFRPKVMLAEATYPETSIPNWGDWEGMLTSSGYECVYFDGLNRFYLDERHGHLKDKFALPPNYFDNFIKHELLLCALTEP